jgi:crossover junction endonuclease MUS81
MDFVVERKQIDDFMGSIVDGRYFEQKYRLSKCGVSCFIYYI